MIGLLIGHFPRALVEGYEELVDVMRNHEGDRHVLAAAVHSGAGVIVTWNRTHFPQEALAPYSIEVQTPDEFLCHLWYLSDDTMAAVLIEQAAALRNPPVTTRQLVKTLSRSVPEFARVLSNSPLLFP
ncbi:MAG TPA: hypothetical protein VFD42_06535 [Chloroflexota bacterium]|nr:hypothetical protein [Chloroflexota bacterium]